MRQGQGDAIALHLDAARVDLLGVVLDQRLQQFQKEEMSFLHDGHVVPCLSQDRQLRLLHEGVRVSYRGLADAQAVEMQAEVLRIERQCVLHPRLQAPVFHLEVCFSYYTKAQRLLTCVWVSQPEPRDGLARFVVLVLFWTRPNQ